MSSWSNDDAVDRDVTWDPANGYVSALPESATVNLQNANWNPSAVNPAASSWEQVLQGGLTRLIDAKTRPLIPQNTQPVQTTSSAGGVSAAGLSLPSLTSKNALVWIGIAALVLLVAVSRKGV